MRNDDETEEMNKGLYIPKKKKPDGYVYPDLKPLLWGARLLMVLSIVFGFVMGNFLVTLFFFSFLCSFAFFSGYVSTRNVKNFSLEIISFEQKTTTETILELTNELR